VAITAEQLPGYLRRLADDIAVKEAPERACTAMGNAYKRVVIDSMRGDSPSPPGTPPARVTGTLARSIADHPLGTRQIREYAAECSVAPHTVYARIQQTGGIITARHMLGENRMDPKSKAFTKLMLQAQLGRKGAQEDLDREVGAGLGFLSWEGKDGVRRFKHKVVLPARPYMVMGEEHRTAVHDAAVQALDGLLP
jgi:phage gpG-like protein